MKNIHIIPTDKPSRLIIYSTLLNEFRLLDEPIEDWKHKKHIYITSDDELKDGDWCILLENHYLNGGIGKYNSKKAIGYGLHNTTFFQKIILTTDQDLIKNGVQAIDDEFLEWFVKNPSCESVEVDSIETNPDYKSNWENRFTYEIIIPKEEAKPHSFCETPEEKCIMNYCDENGCQNRKRELVEPKQETLDEAAENYSLELLEAKTIQPHEKTWIKSMFVHIARLQQERMYSEEEVYHILCEHTAFLFAGGKSTLTDWFEQFKKK